MNQTTWHFDQLKKELEYRSRSEGQFSNAIKVNYYGTF
jgi:hypothetical protein